MQQEVQGLNDSQAQLVETEALASQELADRMAKNVSCRLPYLMTGAVHKGVLGMRLSLSQTYALCM
eukprot:scaffold680423_cov73-Prasinocladus_malaysianus.AAC.1